jgi:DdrB-like protein
MVLLDLNLQNEMGMCILFLAEYEGVPMNESCMQVHFTTRLGSAISIALESEDQLLETLRRYGRQSWTSGEIPAGGLLLPYSLAERFDWSLIGAREAEIEGERGVWYKGHFYKRRELAARQDKKMKLADCVKYSRGAKPTDPAHLREPSGEQEYVTLAVFRGGGELKAYEKPADSTAPRATRSYPASSNAGTQRLNG